MLLIVFGHKNRQIRKIPFFEKTDKSRLCQKQIFNNDNSVSLIQK